MDEILICDRLVQLIDPDKFRSGGLEYGATDNYAHENHLYEFEARNWKVICLQPDEEEFIKLRLFRRLSRLLDCEEDGSISIDEFLGRTNVREIKILLIKNTKSPSKVLSGFSTEKWGTEIVSVQHPSQEEKYKSEEILKRAGFVYLETVAVSDFYVKPGEMFSGQPPIVTTNEKIFEV